MREQTQAETSNELASLYDRISQAVLYGNGYNQAWQLQSLTNLEELPDYEEGWGNNGQTRGAPVDADGNPIFHDVPKSWEAARNDGERWRRLLAVSVRWQPRYRNAMQMRYADFLQSQFGV